MQSAPKKDKPSAKLVEIVEPKNEPKWKKPEPMSDDDDWNDVSAKKKIVQKP